MYISIPNDTLLNHFTVPNQTKRTWKLTSRALKPVKFRFASSHPSLLLFQSLLAFEISMPSATQSANQKATTNESSSSTKSPGSNLSYVPRDARLMALILDSMGIEDVQPPVLIMLLDFAHRYLYEVLQDSLVYADHANSSKLTNSGVSTLTLDDIQLAIQSRVNHSFTGPPSKEVSFSILVTTCYNDFSLTRFFQMLLSLASSLNAVPLPPILDRYGLKLPPRQHCLTNVNFSLVPNPPPQDSSDGDAPGEEEEEDAEDNNLFANNEDAGSDADDVEEMPSASGADADMQDAVVEQRGTKRNLDEDEDYD